MIIDRTLDLDVALRKRRDRESAGGTVIAKGTSNAECQSNRQ
jgi:hypothetical protein